MQPEPSSQELAEFVSRIYSLAYAGKFGEMNDLLDDVRVKNSPTIWLVGYLRITARFRQFLPEWPNLFNAAVKELKTRGEDVDALLGGME